MSSTTLDPGPATDHTCRTRPIRPPRRPRPTGPSSRPAHASDCDVCSRPAPLRLGGVPLCRSCYLGGREREAELGNVRVAWLIVTSPTEMAA